MESNRVYDEDYNLVVGETNERGTTELFKLSEPSMDAVPCSRLERLMMVLSNSPHQALLLLHLNLQGKLAYILLNHYFYNVFQD